MAALRQTYTGETRNAVVPEIHYCLAGLDADDRAVLSATLDGTYLDPLPQHLRGLLIPGAISQPQQHLEASVLDAVSRAGFHHPALLRMVRPHRDRIDLHLQPNALAPLLRELLPTEGPDGSFRGIPGLRAVVHRRHIELYLLHSIPKATLLLPAVSYRPWTEALAEVESPQNPLRWLGNDPTPLRPVELELEHIKPHAALASAILRRLLLFRSPPEVTTSSDHPDVCALDWYHGPSTARVIRALVHQVGGIATTADLFATDTHLSLDTTSTRLLLRGPDLRPETTTERTPNMTSTEHPLTAEALCAHIATSINGGHIHAYGADPADSPLVGHTRTTTVLTTAGSRQRWFKVSVEEIYPAHVSVLSADHDVLVNLARRARIPLPAFGFDPTPLILRP
ncbi:hypothetical protein [Kutzneria sp. NPDC052558]|uniref:hypothetical protein n=1 Tax=Kutzneria sp. NPDC052558 TaxID=3364121 RepID=UPI0037C625E0